jgi:hypothetical protein
VTIKFSKDCDEETEILGDFEKFHNSKGMIKYISLRNPAKFL